MDRTGRSKSWSPPMSGGATPGFPAWFSMICWPKKFKARKPGIDETPQTHRPRSDPPEWLAADRPFERGGLSALSPWRQRGIPLFLKLFAFIFRSLQAAGLKERGPWILLLFILVWLATSYYTLSPSALLASICSKAIVEETSAFHGNQTPKSWCEPKYCNANDVFVLNIRFNFGTPASISLCFERAGLHEKAAKVMLETSSSWPLACLLRKVFSKDAFQGSCCVKNVHGSLFVALPFDCTLYSFHALCRIGQLQSLALRD